MPRVPNASGRCWVRLASAALKLQEPSSIFILISRFLIAAQLGPQRQRTALGVIVEVMSVNFDAPKAFYNRRMFCPSTRIRRFATIVCLAALATPTPHAAAQTYPAKPVRIVVSLAPSGGMDIAARIVGQKLSERWAQQFVVENRPGAGGALGSELVARAPPDGYTLLGASIAYAVIPSSHKNLAYDPVHDLTPVAVMVYPSNMLVVHPRI